MSRTAIVCHVAILMSLAWGCADQSRDVEVPNGAAPTGSKAPVVDDGSAAPAKDALPGKSPSEKPGEGGVSLQVADRAAYDALLAKHKGKVILVDFWARWCLNCMKQFPHTVEMSKKYGGQGLVVISVSLDDQEDEALAKDFLQQKGATFDNLISKDGASDSSFEAFDIGGGGLPHYKLYDRTGKLHRTFSVDPEAKKQFTPEDVEQAVKELLDQPN